MTEEEFGADLKSDLSIGLGYSEMNDGDSGSTKLPCRLVNPGWP
jgi:hypothetical protein